MMDLYYKCNTNQLFWRPPGRLIGGGWGGGDPPMESQEIKKSLTKSGRLMKKHASQTVSQNTMKHTQSDCGKGAL